MTRSGDSGVYLLLLDVPSPARLAIGRLGEQLLDCGRYAYVGSARRALGARLARHCRREKALRWHIDYLRDVARPVAVLVCPWRPGRECRLARALASTGSGHLVLPGFGASDCRCPGHLFRLGGVEMGMIAERVARALSVAPLREWTPDASSR